MNKKIRSFDEFESRFKNQELPEVHYKERQVSEHRKAPIFLRASLITLFLTLFITASVVAAAQVGGWKLFNSEGKQVFELATMSEKEAEPHFAFDRNNAKYRVEMDKVRSTIAEGEFKYFLTVEGYEEIGATAMALIMVNTEIGSVAQIPSEIIEHLHLKENLQNEYELTGGSIAYYPQEDVENIAAIAKKMYLEAKENQVEFIEKTGTLSPEISNVFLSYANKNKENYQGVQIMIYSVNEEMITTEGLEGYVKVTDEGIDFLVNEDEQNLYFVKEDGSKKLLVKIKLTLKSAEGAMKKEELLVIAKSLLN